MHEPRPSSTKLRRQCFEANKYQCPLSRRWLMDCHICGLPIDVIKDGPNSWEAEHVLRRSLRRGNDDDTGNVKPAHKTCHAPKTVEDVRANAKGKRVEADHFGLAKRDGPPMMGSKASPYKKTFRRGWVRRDE